MIADGPFIGSTKSDKYHYSDCWWAEKIKSEWQVWFASSEEARAAEYVPIEVCDIT